jgi:hypothetical protein
MKHEFNSLMTEKSACIFSSNLLISVFVVWQSAKCEGGKETSKAANAP